MVAVVAVAVIAAAAVVVALVVAFGCDLDHKFGRGHQHVLEHLGLADIKGTAS
jgi:hypothetical protein